MTRPKNTKILPYRLFCMLLYGQHRFMDRHYQSVTCPVAILASTLGTRPDRLREYAYALEDWGLVDSVQWNPHWVRFNLKCPVGMVAGDPKETIDV